MSANAGRPDQTLVYRIVHADNLPTLASRGGLHAPAHCPPDGLPYRPIHDEAIRGRRSVKQVPCGPGGSVRDYVSFYLGPRSPMLYRIWRNEVPDYDEGQRPVVYLVSTVETLEEHGLRFVFTDGHSLAAITQWHADPARLDTLRWDDIYADFWFDAEDDNDRCRRKQAELLVHRFVPWAALLGIAVIDDEMRAEVGRRLAAAGAPVPRLRVRRDWYYRP